MLRFLIGCSLFLNVHVTPCLVVESRSAMSEKVEPIELLEVASATAGAKVPGDAAALVEDRFD